MIVSYEVLQDPLDAERRWRVAVGEFFTLEKFNTQEEADAHVGRLQSGLVRPQFGERPVRVRRDVVLETESAVLVRTQVEHEAFTFTTILGDVITWDITRAREAVERRDVVGLEEIPRNVLAEIAASNDWQQDVVDKADPTKHGIAAPLVAMGQVIFILIDGTHRAVNALQTRRPFCAWLLSDAANRGCVVRGREGIIP